MEIELRMRGDHRAHRADWLPLLRERLKLALRRFSGEVTRVRVHLDDVNGPRGGQDKRCVLALSTRDGRQVRLSEQTDHWTTAFAAALERATASLRRQHNRLAREPVRRQRLQTFDATLTGDLDAQLPR
jgi:hypothetical protein